MIAVVFTRLDRHADTAVGLEGTFEGLVCLEAYNGFFLFIQVTGTVRGDGGYDLGIHIQDAAFFPFLSGEVHDLSP